MSVEVRPMTGMCSLLMSVNDRHLIVGSMTPGSLNADSLVNFGGVPAAVRGRLVLAAMKEKYLSPIISHSRLEVACPIPNSIISFQK